MKIGFGLPVSGSWATGEHMARVALRAEELGYHGTIDEIREDFALYEAAGANELFMDLNFDPEIGSPSADAEVSTRRAEEALEAFAPPA